MGRLPNRVPTSWAALSCLCMLVACGCASATVLDDVREGLSTARALPKGSRPRPPQVELSALVGLKRADIEAALKTPTYCGLDLSEPCSPTSPAWAYVWGPPEREIGGDQAGSVTVVFGGPWLLIFEFAGDVVSKVRWQGQR